MYHVFSVQNYFADFLAYCKLFLLVSDWYEGMVTEYLVATFGDYFGDIKV